MLGGSDTDVIDLLDDGSFWSSIEVPYDPQHNFSFITNGYGYMDMAWDKDGAIWAGGGNGTLLVSRDDGNSWELDPVGDRQPSNFTRLVFDGEHSFVLGERGNLLRWVGNAV